MELRVVQPDDAASVQALLVELGYPGDSVAEVRKRLVLWGRREDRTVLAAEAGGRMLGVVALAVIPFFERAGNWCRIVALVVTEEARGRGVGRRLVEAAEGVALESGCISMEVTSALRRDAAHDFYRAMGFEETGSYAARYWKDIVPGASDASYAKRATS